MKKLNDTKHVSRKGVSFNAPEWGVDFFETFSPVIGFDVVRTVLAIATMRGWNLRTPDFNHAYLNAALPEEIWLERPDVSFVKELNAIYGLKQLALKWYKELRDQSGRKYEDRLYINMNTKRSLHFRRQWYDVLATTCTRYGVKCETSTAVLILQNTGGFLTAVQERRRASPHPGLGLTLAQVAP